MDARNIYDKMGKMPWNILKYLFPSDSNNQQL